MAARLRRSAAIGSGPAVAGVVRPTSVTSRGGLLCAASCSSHVGQDEFLGSIEGGVRQAGRQWSLEEVHGAAVDHPVIPAFPEGDYLKFAIGKVV